MATNPTGTTNLTKQIIIDATAAVDTYIQTATNLLEQLNSVIQPLTSTDFLGAASEGYVYFFTNRVKPALDDSLIAANSSLTAGIKSILDGIKVQLLDTVDEELGNNNKSV